MHSPAAAPQRRERARAWTVAQSQRLSVTPEAIEAFLARARRHGLIVHVSKNRFFPHGTVAALAAIAESLAAHATDHEFSAADFRDESGIGRNLTIEVLEFFDRTGFTRRTDAGRRILRPAQDLFGGAG